MLAAGLHGREEIRRVEALLLDVPRELQAALRKRVRPALEPLKKDIPAEAVRRMPAGYGPLLSRATEVYIRVGTGASFSATVKVLATGKREQRDVRSLNAGRLSHPLFGNRRRWYRQRVKPGFVNIPVQRTQKRVVDAAEAARDDVADHILEG
jgi:hypothetical protein